MASYLTQVPPCPTFRVLGHDVSFPHQPYGVQLSFMHHMLLALTRGQNALLEAPTGCGKTLSLLCSALAWQSKRKAELQEQTELARGAAAQALLGSAPGAGGVSATAAAAVAHAAQGGGAYGWEPTPQQSAAAAAATAAGAIGNATKPGYEPGPLPAASPTARPGAEAGPHTAASAAAKPWSTEDGLVGCGPRRSGGGPGTPAPVTPGAALAGGCGERCGSGPCGSAAPDPHGAAQLAGGRGDGAGGWCAATRARGPSHATLCATVGGQRWRGHDPGRMPPPSACHVCVWAVCRPCVWRAGPPGSGACEPPPSLPRIFFATRTHSQIAQVCGDAPGGPVLG
jgi:hypothetical protein